MALCFLNLSIPLYSFVMPEVSHAPMPLIFCSVACVFFLVLCLHSLSCLVIGSLFLLLAVLHYPYTTRNDYT